MHQKKMQKNCILKVFPIEQIFENYKHIFMKIKTNLDITKTCDIMEIQENSWKIMEILITLNFRDKCNK